MQLDLAKLLVNTIIGTFCVLLQSLLEVNVKIQYL